MISDPIVESLKAVAADGLRLPRPEVLQIDYFVTCAVISEMVASQLVTEDGIKDVCRRVAADFADLAAKGASFGEVAVFTYARTVADRIPGELRQWQD